ncbi:hypothetical protein V2O64_05055 [Verrucomicrobiaceae bacterium 227]
MDPASPIPATSAPPALEASEELPTLEFGVPEPEVYLPGTPLWVWIAIGTAVLALLLLIIWLVRRFKKPAPPTPPPAPNHLNTAISSLNRLETVLENHPLNEIASAASLILRNYLAASCAEPALYETSEEFKARQMGLPKEATTLLNDLSDAKYSKSTTDQDKALSFIKRSRTCLETIHAARNVTS